MQFVEMSNAGIREQEMGVTTDGIPLYRKPIFDLKIKAQKKNPFSRMEQNERAKELYGLGFFSPDRAQEALGALEMMEFEGIDKVREQVRQGQTLLAVCQRLSQQVEQMAAIIQGLTGQDLGAGESGGSAGGTSGDPSGQSGKAAPTGGNAAADGVMRAQQPMTDYGTRLAQRSKPSMDSKSSAASPV